jgi:hypothetical protein
VVRLELTTTRAAALLIKDDVIRTELKSAFLVAPMRRLYTDDIDRQRVEVPTGLPPLEALELFLRRTARHESGRQQQLIEAARALMQSAS